MNRKRKREHTKASKILRRLQGKVTSKREEIRKKQVIGQWFGEIVEKTSLAE